MGYSEEQLWFFCSALIQIRCFRYLGTNIWIVGISGTYNLFTVLDSPRRAFLNVCGSSFVLCCCSRFPVRFKRNGYTYKNNFFLDLTFRTGEKSQRIFAEPMRSGKIQIILSIPKRPMAMIGWFWYHAENSKTRGGYSFRDSLRQQTGSALFTPTGTNGFITANARKQPINFLLLRARRAIAILSS